MEALAYQELKEMDKELEAFKKAQLQENEKNKSNMKHYIIIQKFVSIGSVLKGLTTITIFNKKYARHQVHRKF